MNNYEKSAILLKAAGVKIELDHPPNEVTTRYKYVYTNGRRPVYVQDGGSHRILYARRDREYIWKNHVPDIYSECNMYILARVLEWLEEGLDWSDDAIQEWYIRTSDKFDMGNLFGFMTSCADIGLKMAISSGFIEVPVLPHNGH